MTFLKWPHGHVNTYKAGCRCSACREANRVYQSAANARRRLDPSGADRAGHGKRSTYNNYGCRCLLCRVASANAQRDYRERRKAGAQ